MAHSEKCPVCKGKGFIYHKAVDAFDPFKVPNICHGCNGTGWIVVTDNVTYLEYAK